MSAPEQQAPPAQLVPLRRVSELSLTVPAHQGWIESLVWQPIAYSELHLCSHYYPITIRLVRGEPLLGVLLSREFLVRPLVDDKGAWQSGYLPMAIRSFPFQSTGRSDNPLDDLIVPAGSPWFSPNGSVRIVEPGGRVHPQIINTQMLCRRLSESRQSLAPVLDLLLVADVLRPVLALRNGADGQETPFLTVERERMNRLSKTALVAMARHRFAAVDIMVASSFSQAQLRPSCRPLAAAPTAASMASAPPVSGFGAFQLNDVIVDDGELLSYSDLEAALATLPRNKSGGFSA